MNILVLANKVPYPPKDGGAIATGRMVEGLLNCGNSVVIRAINTLKHPYNPGDIPSHLKEKILLDYITLDTRVKIPNALYYLFFTRKAYIAQRFHHASFSTLLEKTLKERKIDIVQVEGLYMLQYLPVIKKYSSALIAYRPHNLEHEIWEQLGNDAFSGWKKRYSRNLGKRILRLEKQWMNRYDMIIPISPEDFEEFRRWGVTVPGKVIPVGIPKGITRSVGTVSHKDFLFIGALDWVPNQEAILWFVQNVWNKFQAVYPEAILHIAGRNCPDELKPKLMKPGVIFYGELEDAGIFFQKGFTMIIPVFSGSGMRVKTLEAMAYEKAVISTTRGMRGIQAKPGVHFLQAENKQDFFFQMEKCFSLPGEIISLGQHAGEFVRDYYMNDSLVKKLHDFYVEKIP